MAPYNLSFMDNATNIVDLMVGVGTQIGSDFLLGDMILFGFFTLFLLGAFKYNFTEVLVVDSFLTTLLAILLYVPGLVAGPHIAVPAVVFFIAIIIYFFSQR